MNKLVGFGRCIGFIASSGIDNSQSISKNSPKNFLLWKLVLALIFLTLATACSGKAVSNEQTNSEPSKSVQPTASATPDPSENPVPLADVGTSELQKLNKPATGDLAEITERRFVRALVAYNRTTYFIDGKEQKGIAYDSLVELEKWLHTESTDRNRGLKVAIIPTARDRLLPALAEGLGDIAIGNLTVTQEREKIVDFTDPVMDNAQELVVTGPSAPSLSTLDDLSGQEVYVRQSSSYRRSLDKLNETLHSASKAPVKIKLVDEALEDDDILQMVDAGVFGIAVVDKHTIDFWSQVYDRVKAREDLVLRSGGRIAWAVRKNCPDLKAILNQFISTHRTGTTFGNIMFKRYLGSAERLKNPRDQEQMDRFRVLVTLFRKYSDEYSLPWLLVAAQGYQESQLDQQKRSPAGAVGVMQIKPEVAADVGINDISQAETNIHAGIKYLRFILDRYFKDAPMDRVNKGLFAFASYNAGPARVAGLRKKAEELGLNPNVWFNNVEIVAAREIGRETVDYVSNIFKYYTTYLAISEQNQQREKAAKKKAGS
ncbi:MAG TPA: lytic transglycosylase F [Blastocatellia bacterium]|nr:lytic transglycosylase F [Blastocatellia bacterium]